MTKLRKTGHWLLFSWLSASLLGPALADGPALPTSNSGKNVVLICMLEKDRVIYSGCSYARRRLKDSGWNVIDIDLTDQDTAEKIKAVLETKLKGLKLSPTAPVFVHGHGRNGSSHSLEVSRWSTGSDWLSGQTLLEEVRTYLPTNPFWVSSCFSQSECYQKDCASGTSCQAGELSSGNIDGVEYTLAYLVNALSSPYVFEKADLNLDGKLDPGELNRFFCASYGNTRELEKRVVSDLPKRFRAHAFKAASMAAKRSPTVAEEVESLKRKYPQAQIRQKEVQAFVFKNGSSLNSNTELMQERFENLLQAREWVKQNIFSHPKLKRLFKSQGEPKDIWYSIVSVGNETEISAVVPADKPCFKGDGGIQHPQVDKFTLYSPAYDIRQKGVNRTFKDLESRKNHAK